MHRTGLRCFVVFEPSYAFGCLALLSSLARHASQPITVDILLRREYCDAAERAIAPLQRAYADKLELRQIVVPDEIVARCAAHRFRGHFIAEVLFRLYYFELVADVPDHVIYLDLDMVLLGDIFEISNDCAPPALLYAVEADLTAPSRRTMPPHIVRYLNSGLLVFQATDLPALQGAMRNALKIVAEIADQALYLDQDAINIAFYDKTTYLPNKWNFTLSDFVGYPLPADIVVLHATGSRKPWFYRGMHPFTPWYEKEADHLRLPFGKRYDFAWAPRRLMKKARALWPG